MIFQFTHEKQIKPIWLRNFLYFPTTLDTIEQCGRQIDEYELNVLLNTKVTTPKDHGKSCMKV